MTTDWGDFPKEFIALATELRSDDKTQPTANALTTVVGSYISQWRQAKRLTSAGEGIPLPIPRNQGLHPVGCDVEDAFLNFDFEVRDDKPLPTVANFTVKVTGRLEFNQVLVRLEDHWRVDTDFDATTKGREAHPAYHFQRGGHAQDDFIALGDYVPGNALPKPGGAQWRALMQSPGPRVPSIPMCPVLAIDYSISQHDGPAWRKLRDRPEYTKIISLAQKRLWVPFFDQLAHATARRELLGSLLAI